MTLTVPCSVPGVRAFGPVLGWPSGLARSMQRLGPAPPALAGTRQVGLRSSTLSSHRASSFHLAGRLEENMFCFRSGLHDRSRTSSGQSDWPRGVATKGPTHIKDAVRHRKCPPASHGTRNRSTTAIPTRRARRPRAHRPTPCRGTRDWLLLKSPAPALRPPPQPPVGFSVMRTGAHPPLGAQY